MITFNHNNQSNELLCNLTGRMSADNAVPLTDSIQGKLNEIKAGSLDPSNVKVTFDLMNVDYIASSFIRICVATAKQVGTGKFSIINTSPMIKKTFKIAGLDEILNVS